MSAADPRPGSQATLVCLPHAGGVAADYRRWPTLVRRPVVAISYPGREAAFRDPLLRSIEELAVFTIGRLPPGPVALFGHSLGSLVAFEVARRLERQGRAVVGLVVAGHGPPTASRRRQPIHALPDARLLEELTELGGMDPRILAEPELLDLLLPRLRADLEAAETYRPTDTTPVDCPILALGGTSDRHVEPADLEGWRPLTRGRFRSRLIDGGHFFVGERTDDVTGAIEELLAGAG